MQVESATSAFHDEKIDEQTMKEPQEEIKKIDDPQEKTRVTAPQSSDDQLPKEPATADITVAPEPELAEAEPEAEPEALAAEVETKVVLKEEKEEEVKINPVDQTAKVAPEPCVEEEAKTETETENEPAEVAKVEPEREPEAEPEEKAVEKEEVIAAEE